MRGAPVKATPAAPDSGGVTGWIGWVLFAGILLVTVGLFNAIEGLVALFGRDFYRVTRSELLGRLDYPAYGWTLLALGVLLGLAGYGVMAGRMWARIVAVVAAVVNAFTNFAFMAAYPIWTSLTIALDVIIIYALIAHGSEAKALHPDGE